MRRVATLASAMLAAIILTLSANAYACVGKTLVIGCAGSPDVAVVSQMMAVLIVERTGTTVVVKHYDSFDKCLEALKACDVNMMIDFTGRSYVEGLGNPPESDADKVFNEVKDVYQRKMNLVWLEPFGFTNTNAMDPKKAGSTPMIAAPIIRKDTMTKFPALPKVLARLAGKLDNDTVAKLAASIGKDDKEDKKAKKVVRKFLKDKRMI